MSAPVVTRESKMYFFQNVTVENRKGKKHHF